MNLPSWLNLNFRLKPQRGVYAVEFAIIGAIFLMLLLSIIEMGRLYFTYNVLYEVSRRAARLAVVCQVNDLDVNTMARFNGINMVPNLDASNVSISYHQFDDTAATGLDIDFVKAQIINYQHQFLVPGLHMTLDFSPFTTNLPRESLGVYKVDEDDPNPGTGFIDCI